LYIWCVTGGWRKSLNEELHNLVLFRNYEKYDQIMYIEIGEPCSMQGADEKYIKI
jgi:hypothetical protein